MRVFVKLLWIKGNILWILTKMIDRDDRMRGGPLIGQLVCICLFFVYLLIYLSTYLFISETGVHCVTLFDKNLYMCQTSFQFTEYPGLKASATTPSQILIFGFVFNMVSVDECVNKGVNLGIKCSNSETGNFITFHPLFLSSLSLVI